MLPFIEKAVPKNLAAASIVWLLAWPTHADTWGVLTETLSNPFWGATEPGGREGAAAAGVECCLQAAGGSRAVEPLLNACGTMPERPPDAMITAAINSTVRQHCLQQVNETGIPVVDLGGILDNALAADAGICIVFRRGNVAADPPLAGAEVVEAVSVVVGAGV